MFFYYNDINKEYHFFISKHYYFLSKIVVRFAVPVKKSGTVGTVPTVPGATAVYYNKSSLDKILCDIYSMPITVFPLHYLQVIIL